MKRLQGNVGEEGLFERLSRQVEDRMGHWPTWRKVIVGIPVIVLMTTLFMFSLLFVSDGVLAVIRVLHH